MDAAQVQVLVDAAVAVALMAAAIPAPRVHAPPTIFARTPAQANVGIVNYGSSEGMKIYNAVVAALSTKYSGNSSEMHIFLNNVNERGRSFGWQNILNVPKDGGTRNLVDQYGLVTLEDIRAHALIYKNALARDAQNASQMYNFLYSSLSEDNAKLTVLSNFTNCTIITEGGIQVCNGPCFMKVIIWNTTVETRSTVFHIRENLNHLEGKMLELTYDTEAFNICLTGQFTRLAACGELSSDLLINLFATFMTVPDAKFVECIEKQKDKLDEGEDKTRKKFMQVALTKYKDRKRSDTWQTPSAKEEQILTLTAQISNLKRAKANPATNEKGSKGTTKQGIESTNTSKAKIAEKYAWKLVPPASGEPTTKEHNKKTYHFCPRSQQ